MCYNCLALLVLFLVYCLTNFFILHFQDIYKGKWRFFIFKMVVVRHLGYLVWKFYGPYWYGAYSEYALPCEMSSKSVIHCGTIVILWFFKMTTIRYLGFLETLNFIGWRDMEGRAIFGQNWSILCGDCIFLFFKMAAVCHLGFLKSLNFTSWWGPRGQHASLCQILSKSVCCRGKWFFDCPKWLPSAMWNCLGVFGLPMESTC